MDRVIAHALGFEHGRSAMLAYCYRYISMCGLCEGLEGYAAKRVHKHLKLADSVRSLLSSLSSWGLLSPFTHVSTREYSTSLRVVGWNTAIHTDFSLPSINCQLGGGLLSFYLPSF